METRGVRECNVCESYYVQGNDHTCEDCLRERANIAVWIGVIVVALIFGAVLAVR